jgi:transcriptional regulator with XRE-family HTH domain
MSEIEDPVMARIRDWFEASGLTLHDVGLRMGYSEDIARKSVWQFLKSKDPRIGMLRKFAAAAGVSIENLVGESKPEKRSKM